MTVKWEDYGESSLTLLSAYCHIEKNWPATPHDCYDLYKCFHLIECLGLSKKEENWLLEEAALAYRDWVPFFNHWWELRSMAKSRRWNKRLNALIFKCNQERPKDKVVSSTKEAKK